MRQHWESALGVRPAGGRRPDSRLGRSVLLRRAARRPWLLAAFLVSGFALGVAYRFLLDPAAERELANYLRSGVHGLGIAAAAWAVQAGFAAGVRSRLGAALRRLPVGGEILVRAAVTTAALVAVGVGLQLVLYAEPLRLHWLTGAWFATHLPRIVAIGFVLSLVLGAATEAGRMIGGPLFASILLGTYHRPAREERIVMFLDLAGSTRLAEEMGELRVHDLITRFFFDIDEPIADHGGAVHAYVGDAVIVTWPGVADPAKNARSVACFFAIESKMAGLAADYRAEFNVVPRFRAALHLGPVIVSECGDARRQLAYFGDTMNVAARLCDYCKTVEEPLVVSSDLLHRAAIAAGLRVAAGASVALRGRRERVEAHAVSRKRQR